MMRKVYFVETSKTSYGRSYEHLVRGAIDTSRIVAVQAGGFHSRFESTVELLTDDGRALTVKGCVDDWLDAEDADGAETSR